MGTVNPYLNFQGNTEEAFDFYKSVFGGEFALKLRFKDTPEKDRVPADEQDKLMHIALPIGKTSVLMATDALESMGHRVTPGTNSHISYHADSKEDADKIFNGLSAGGTVSVPLNQTFWGSYFGMLVDKFGISWMVSYDGNYATA